MSTSHAGPPAGSYQPLPPQPEKPKKGRRVPLWVLIAVFVVTMFASCGVGAAAAGSGESDAPELRSAKGADASELDRREQSLEERNEELNDRHADLDDRAAQLDEREAGLDEREKKLEGEEKKAAENTIPGDGTFVVGEDVKPGTYRTDGPSDSSVPCYWARLESTSGDFDDLITNGNPEGPTTVTIAKADGAFQTNGCQDWKRR